MALGKEAFLCFLNGLGDIGLDVVVESLFVRDVLEEGGIGVFDVGIQSFLEGADIFQRRSSRKPLVPA